MSREERQEWAVANDAEHQGFYEHQTLKIARRSQTLDLRHDDTYRVHYCEWAIHQAQGAIVLVLCVMGNQQKEEVHYQLGQLYAPVMKAAEMRLFMALAIKHGLTVFKSDTKQAFLNGEIRDEKIYISTPDWWPERVGMPYY